MLVIPLSGILTATGVWLLFVAWGGGLHRIFVAASLVK